MSKLVAKQESITILVITKYSTNCFKSDYVESNAYTLDSEVILAYVEDFAHSVFGFDDDSVFQSERYVSM